ncbi:MAG TPA: type II secretion system protein [Opitutaceae bacterium]
MSCRRRCLCSWRSQTCASSRGARCSFIESTCPNDPSGREAGFSLLELAVVVLIIGMLAAAAVPALKKNAINARTSAVMNDLRVYSGAFQAYAQEHGDWPPGGGAPGVFPAGMEGYLSQTNWSRTTPIGGNYQFATQSPQGGGRYAAVIIISNSGTNLVSSDANQLTDIDRKLDDGNLSAGNFFLGYRNYPVFVLEH